MRDRLIFFVSACSRGEGRASSKTTEKDREEKERKKERDVKYVGLVAVELGLFGTSHVYFGNSIFLQRGFSSDARELAGILGTSLSVLGDRFA